MWFSEDVVIELSGITAAQQVPIIRDHDPGKIVGHSTKVTTEGKVRLEGIASGAGPDAAEFIASSRNGFPWKASIGAVQTKPREWIPQGATVSANGQTFKGPLWYYPAVQLIEASVLPIPADPKSAAKVAAQSANPTGGQDMPQPKKNGQTSPETTASGETPQNPSAATQVAAAAGAAPETQPPAATIQAAAPGQIDDAQINAARDEYRKIRTEWLKRERDIRAAARGDEALVIRAMDEDWTVDRVRAEAAETALAAAGAAPAVHTAAANANQFQIIIAAAMTSLGTPTATLEAQFAAPVLEAAARHEGIGLVETIQLALRASGNRTPMSHKSDEFIRAAFTTHEVANVLGAVTRGYMLSAYNALPQVWRKFCHIGRTETFNPENRYRLAGTGMSRITDTGELPSFKLKDAKYTAQVDTQGALISITRKDIINDNFSAFQQILQIAGRSAWFLVMEALATAMIDAGSAFYASGNGNYASGSTTALAYDALSTQIAAFMDQTGVDDKVIGMEPAFLVVPTALKSTADRLYKSDRLVATGVGSSAKLAGATNDLQGQCEPVVISQLGAAAGGSDTAYYLFPDPAMAPAIEVSFLRGIQRPTLEQVPPPAGVLALNWNGYIDFGVNYLETAATRKVKGAA